MKTTNRNRYHSVISWVSGLVALIGIAVVLGWVMDIKILRTIKPDYDSMKFNTALGFILSGASLFLSVKNAGRQSSFIIRIFALVVFTLGALTFLETIFNYNIGLDQLLLNDFETSAINAPFPGRMAPTTSICFMLVALYMLFFNAEKKYRSIAQGLLHLVTLISFIAIIGYLFNVSVFYKISFFTSMAVHTAVCFFLLSVAGSLMNPSLGLTGLFTGAGIGNIMARKIFFQITIAILVLGYLRILAHRYNLVSVEFGIALYATSFILISLFLICRVSIQLNVIDIKKQQAEGNLSKITAFLDATPDPIVIVDSEGIIRLLNNETEKIFGYAKNELIGQNITMLIPDLLKNQYSGHIIKFLTSLKQQTINSGSDMFAIRKDGQEFPFEITTSSIETTEGSYISAAFRDISIRKSEEKKIKEMASIIAHSSDIIFSQDNNGTILSWNRSAEKLLGYNSNEIIGQQVSILFPDEKKDEAFSLTTKILNLHHIDQYETVRLKKNGTPVTVAITMSPIKDTRGNTIAISTILRDISQQKAIEILQKDSYERYQLFIQQAPNALAMFDKNMCYLAASKTWLQEYNLIGKEIIGHSHYEIFPEIGDYWKAIHQAGLKGEINHCEEELFERADGSEQWISWDARPWYLSEGNIGGLMLYTSDITSLKQKDRDRRRIEAILDKTNEVALIGTWELDLLKNKINWSRITKKIHEVPMDYEPDFVSGINFYREGESRLKIEMAVNEAIKNGTPYDLELEIVTAKGNIVWVRVIGQAELKNGICRRLYGVFQDINATIKSRQALQQLNGELDILLNTGNVSIIGTNKEGLITYFNKGAEMMLQYAASEMIGIQTPEIIHDKDEMVKRGNELSEMYGCTISGFSVFVEMAKRHNFDSTEWTYVRKDGTSFPIQLGVTAILNEQGLPIGFLKVATDISKIKNAEIKLVELNGSIQSINRQLNQKNEELEQFAFVAAHDLQEPLRMVSSFLTLLEQKYAPQLDDKAKQYIRYSVDGALRMRDLIRDILNFSKSGTFVNKELNLNKLVNGIALDYKNDEKYQSATIDVGALPVINADISAMQQLFTNLVGNGLKYQPADNMPVIKVTAEALNDRWLFKIADNGIGIDPKHYDQVFGIFKRLHTKSAYSGTGIGLATCKKIVNLYNGDIWIESNNGNGSVFCFTLPK